MLRGWTLRSTERVEALVRVADERQAHLSRDIVASTLSLSTKSCTGIVLINLINREVLRINVRLQFRLKRCPDASQAIPLYATEEGVLLDLVGTADPAKTVLGITD